MSTLRTIIMRLPRAKRPAVETSSAQASRDALALAPAGLMRLSGW